MARYALIGPTYPYRGGIAHYTTLLAQALRERHEVLFISFSQQYPAWLFPGRSDRDPSERPLRADAEYLLAPLSPLSWRRTLARLSEWGPEVVVMQWWHPFWAPAWHAVGRGVKRLTPRPKLLFICHNVLPHEQGKFSFLIPWLTRLTLAPGDGFILHAVSDAQILRGLLPQARCRVTPIPTYAALGEREAVALPVSLPADRPLLLFAGFVRPYKGLDILLEAMALLERPLHLLVVGEFWQGTTPYEAQIARLGLGEKVTLWDEYLPDELLAACLRRADVVVLPYRSATQSAVVQTAFGQGKPVITTNVGGLAEVVDHERTGLVVPPEDPAALAAAIERFFAEEMGVMMGENVVGENGRFAWEHLARQLTELGT